MLRSQSGGFDMADDSMDCIRKSGGPSKLRVNKPPHSRIGEE